MSLCQHSLICAMRNRNPEAVECAALCLGLLDGPNHISFNALCCAELGRYPAVPLAWLKSVLLHKLQVTELSAARMKSRSDRSRKSRRAGKFNRWIEGGVKNLLTGRTCMGLGEDGEGWQHALGFYVLEYMAGLCGYRQYLRARYTLGETVGFRHLREPAFLDLMLWSVLLGNFKLSRVLWRRCRSPLRAAVMCSRLCLKLKDTSRVTDEEELQCAADEFEDLAVGILNQLDDPTLATDILTYRTVHRAAIQGAGPKVVRMWPDSITDQAMSTPYPCRRSKTLHARANRMRTTAASIVHLSLSACVCVP